MGPEIIRKYHLHLHTNVMCIIQNNARLK